MPEYFVAYEYEPTRWRHIRDNAGAKATFTASDTDNATGLAAIQEQVNGKYFAVDVANAAVDVNSVTLQQTADNTNVAFDS
jgi:hypothetical protein